MFTAFAPLQSQARSHHEQLIADAARTRRGQSLRRRGDDAPERPHGQAVLRLVSAHTG